MIRSALQGHTPAVCDGAWSAEDATEDPDYPFPESRQAQILAERTAVAATLRRRLNSYPVACTNMTAMMGSLLVSDACHVHRFSFNDWKFHADRYGVHMSECPRTKTGIDGSVRSVEFTVTASQAPLDECVVTLTPSGPARTPKEAREVPCWLYGVKHAEGKPLDA